ncbi:hypothetical protein Pmar_PMAR010075 [Perkinsus marinus ATCC 50983]|uniref:EF-hand domain-containing protein n=1 Tax=Perkinsus marinus (strain ATCC 50983 / TXsc) TaxID=423536 RepID=C5K4R8_PERM5|nr:hypothetical protein Pmar_PMAR010075 [Perkinsus marinus ATCC 50983]EER20340.1 hypothetical protein Pmar_PMAR010075 [Perkinsus marinus ATCC 50983]|eukprot:XP_002788544.1 hypothetical protein Pmar_PMAR010075 [Perkinsus marinus ATCC 50983]
MSAVLCICGHSVRCPHGGASTGEFHPAGQLLRARPTASVEVSALHPTAVFGDRGGSEAPSAPGVDLAAHGDGEVCNNALAALTMGGTPAFEVEVFRGSSLDTSPLEVEGDIEIINWRDTMSFRRTVARILEGSVRGVAGRVLRHGITGDEVLVSSHKEGILLAYQVPGPHIGFTAYAEAAWGGTRAHLDVLDDLHTLQERLMQSGVEASIRVRDVRVMSGLVYRAKRALYSYCSHLDHRGKLSVVAPVSVAEEWGREEAQSQPRDRGRLGRGSRGPRRGTPKGHKKGEEGTLPVSRAMAAAGEAGGSAWDTLYGGSDGVVGEGVGQDEGFRVAEGLAGGGAASGEDVLGHIDSPAGEELADTGYHISKGPEGNNRKGEDGHPEIEDGHPEVEDGHAEVEDGHPEGEDGRPEVEDGHAEGEDGHPEGEDGHPEVEDGHAEGEDGHPEGEDGPPEVEDGHAEGEDGHPEGEDGHPEVEDGHAEGEDGHPEGEDRHPEVDDGHPAEEESHPEGQEGHHEKMGLHEGKKRHRVQNGPRRYVGNLEQIDRTLLGPVGSSDLPRWEDVADGAAQSDPGQLEGGVPEMPGDGVADDLGQTVDGVPDGLSESGLAAPTSDFGPDFNAYHSEEVKSVDPAEDLGPGSDAGYLEGPNPVSPTGGFGPGFEPENRTPEESVGSGAVDDFTYHFDEDTMEDAARLPSPRYPVDSGKVVPDVGLGSVANTPSVSTQPTRRPGRGLSKPPARSRHGQDDYDDTIVEGVATNAATPTSRDALTNQPVGAPLATVERPLPPGLIRVARADVEDHRVTGSEIDPVVRERELHEPDFGPGFGVDSGGEGQGLPEPVQGEDGVIEGVDDGRDGVAEPVHGEDGVIEGVDDGRDGLPEPVHGEDGVIEGVDDGRDGVAEPVHGEDGVIEGVDDGRDGVPEPVHREDGVIESVDDGRDGLPEPVHGEDGVIEGVDDGRDGLPEPVHGEDGVIEGVDDGRDGLPEPVHGEDGVIEGVDDGRDGLPEPVHGEDGVIEGVDDGRDGVAEPVRGEGTSDRLPHGRGIEGVTEDIFFKMEGLTSSTTGPQPEKVGNTLEGVAAAGGRIRPPPTIAPTKPGHGPSIRPYYDPLFHLHPFAPRLVYSSPGTHPPDWVVIPVSSSRDGLPRVAAAFRRELGRSGNSADGSSSSHPTPPKHAHGETIYDVSEPREPTPSDGEFVVGMRGFAPPGKGCLSRVMQWIDNSTIAKLEGLRSLLAELYSMEAPVHDQVAFGAFVRRGLLGEDPHLTTFHRLYQGIEHLRGRKCGTEEATNTQCGVVGDDVRPLECPQLFRNAPVDVYVLLDEDGDGRVSLSEWTRFGRIVRAPAFVFTEESFVAFATKEDPQYVSIKEVDDIFRAIGQGELLTSMAERDGHVRTVMDSLALESRFSQLDNFRSFELSLEEVGWTTLSGRGLFYYLDTNRDGYLSRYEWQRMLIINRAPIAVRRLALWLTEGFESGPFPLPKGPFLAATHAKLARLPPTYARLVDRTLDSLGTGRPSDADYSILRAIGGGTEMANLVASEVLLGYRRRPRLSWHPIARGSGAGLMRTPLVEVADAAADGMVEEGEAEQVLPEGGLGGPGGVPGSFMEMGRLTSEAHMKVARYSIGALASGRRVPYETFRDFGRSLKAREGAFTEEVFHLFVGGDETSNEITVDDFDRLHLSSKDMRNLRRVYLVCDSLAIMAKFDEMDRDGDGQLGRGEVPLEPHQAWVYGVLDRDGSGWVSLSELQVLAGMHPDAVPPSALWLSRRVSATSLWTAEGIREKFQSLSPYQQSEVGQVLDVNGDGYLDDHELSLLRLFTEGELIEALLPPLLYEPGRVSLDSMWDRRRFLANTRRMQSMTNVFTVKAFEALAVPSRGPVRAAVEVPVEVVKGWLYAVGRRRLRELLRVFSMINAEAFFKSADIDKDGRVTLEELERLFPPLRGMNEVLEAIGSEGPDGTTSLDWPSLQQLIYAFTAPLQVAVFALDVVAKSKGSDMHAVASRVLRGIGPEEKAAVLNVFDVDRDGELDEVEVPLLGLLGRSETVETFNAIQYQGFKVVMEASLEVPASALLETDRPQLEGPEGYATVSGYRADADGDHRLSMKEMEDYRDVIGASHKVVSKEVSVWIEGSAKEKPSTVGLVYGLVEALQLHAKFVDMDRDGDEELSKEELVGVGIKAEEAAWLRHLLGTVNSSSISEREWMTLAGTSYEAAPDAAVWVATKLPQRDKNYTVDLARVMVVALRQLDTLTKDEVEDARDFIDIDGDGKLSASEFGCLRLLGDMHHVVELILPLEGALEAPPVAEDLTEVAFEELGRRIRGDEKIFGAEAFALLSDPRRKLIPVRVLSRWMQLRNRKHLRPVAGMFSAMNMDSLFYSLDRDRDGRLSRDELNWEEEDAHLLMEELTRTGSQGDRAGLSRKSLQYWVLAHSTPREAKLDMIGRRSTAGNSSEEGLKRPEEGGKEWHKPTKRRKGVKADQDRNQSRGLGYEKLLYGAPEGVSHRDKFGEALRRGFEADLSISSDGLPHLTVSAYVSDIDGDGVLSHAELNVMRAHSGSYRRLFPVEVLKLLGDNTTGTVDMQYFEALHLATKHSANLPLIYRFVEALLLHDRFMQFDKDGDNELTLEEVEIKAEDADKRWFFGVLDSDGSGKLSRTEWQRLAGRSQDATPAVVKWMATNKLPRRDDSVEKDTAIVTVKVMGELAKSGKQDVDELVRFLDEDGDGKVAPSEFGLIRLASDLMPIMEELIPYGPLGHGVVSADLTRGTFLELDQTLKAGRGIFADSSFDDLSVDGAIPLEVITPWTKLRASRLLGQAVQLFDAASLASLFYHLDTDRNGLLSAEELGWDETFDEIVDILWEDEEEGRRGVSRQALQKWAYIRTVPLETHFLLFESSMLRDGYLSDGLLLRHRSRLEVSSAPELKIRLKSLLKGVPEKGHGKKHRDSEETTEGLEFFDLDGSGEIEESEAVLVQLLLGPDAGRASFEEVFTDLLKKAFGADRDLGGAMVESMWHDSLFEIGSPRPEESTEGLDAVAAFHDRRPMAVFPETRLTRRSWIEFGRQQLGAGRTFSAEVFDLLRSCVGQEGLSWRGLESLYRVLKDGRGTTRLVKLMRSIGLEARFTELDVDRDGWLSRGDMGCASESSTVETATGTSSICLAYERLMSLVPSEALGRGEWQVLALIDPETLPPAASLFVSKLARRYDGSGDPLAGYEEVLRGFPDAVRVSIKDFITSTDVELTMTIMRLAVARDGLLPLVSSEGDAIVEAVGLMDANTDGHIDAHEFIDYGMAVHSPDGVFSMETFDSLLDIGADTIPVEALVVFSRLCGCGSDLISLVGAAFSAVNMKARFQMLDTDHDGVLSRVELVGAGGTVGRRALKLLSLIDMDSSGSISLKEWQHWSRLEAAAPIELRQVALLVESRASHGASTWTFDGLTGEARVLAGEYLDYNGDGMVSARELGMLGLLGGEDWTRKVWYEQLYHGFEAALGASLSPAMSLLQTEHKTIDDAADKPERGMDLKRFREYLGVTSPSSHNAAVAAFAYLDTDADGRINADEGLRVEGVRKYLSDYGFIRLVSDTIAVWTQEVCLELSLWSGLGAHLVSSLKVTQGSSTDTVSLVRLAAHGDADQCSARQLSAELYESYNIHIPEGLVEIPWQLWRLVVWRHLTSEFVEGGDEMSSWQSLHID